MLYYIYSMLKFLSSQFLRGGLVLYLVITSSQGVVTSQLAIEINHMLQTAVNVTEIVSTQKRESKIDSFDST